MKKKSRLFPKRVSVVCLFLLVFFLLSQAGMRVSAETDTVEVQTSASLPVLGSLPGSMPSEWVENRQVWQDLPEPVRMEYGVLSAERINLPRFLLDSEDAAAANVELDALAEELGEAYIEARGLDYVSDIHADFSVYQDERVLSVMIRSFSGSQAVDDQYLLYNFSLPEGKRLTDTELAEMLGVGEQIVGLEEEAISRSYKEQGVYNGDPMMDVYGPYLPRYFQGFALQDFWNRFDPAEGRLFLDATGQLRLVYTSYMPAGAGSYTITTEVDQLMNYRDRELNPVYVRMARELGMDPEDERFDGMIAFLGGTFDESSVDQTLARLWPWQRDFLDYELPTVLLRADLDLETGNYTLQSYELYLLVPRMKHAVVSMRGLEMSEAGELLPAEDLQLETRTAVGAVLIGQNLSDLYPNAEVFLSYREDLISFTPTISLKDGSLLSHERLLNANALFRQEPFSPEELESTPLAWDLKTVFLQMLGLWTEPTE